MKQIYLIQSSFVKKDSFSALSWSNLYCVSSEDVAQDDCKRFQIESDNLYDNSIYKFIYRYVKMDLF